MNLRQSIDNNYGNFFGKDNVVIINDNKNIRFITLEELYNHCKVNEKCIDNNKCVYFKNIKDDNIFILENNRFVKILGLTKKKNNGSLKRIHLDNQSFVDVTDESNMNVFNNVNKNVNELVKNYDKLLFYNCLSLLNSKGMFKFNKVVLDNNSFVSNLNIYKNYEDNNLITFKSLYNNEWQNIKLLVDLNYDVGYILGLYFSNIINNKRNNDIFIIENKSLEYLININKLIYNNFGFSCVIFFDDTFNNFVLYSVNTLFINFLNSFIDYENKCFVDDIIKYDIKFIDGTINGIFKSLCGDYYYYQLSDLNQYIYELTKLYGQLTYLFTCIKSKKNIYWSIITDINEIKNDEFVYNIVTENNLFLLHNTIVNI